MRILSVSLFICALSLSVSCVFYKIEEADQLFNKFMLDFDKHYSTEDEKMMRFSLFKKNLEKVNEMNKEHGSEVFGITMMSDLTEQEKNKYLNIRDIPCDNQGCDSEEIEDIQLPDHFDWRDHGLVSPVKNQEQCGSCLAFSTVAAMESHLLKINKTLTISEKQVLDCNTYGFDCFNGGCTNFAFRYFKDNGAMSDRDYPYAPVQGECKYEASKVVAKVTRCVSPSTKGSLKKLKQALVTYGPLSVLVNATSWFSYNGKVWDCKAEGNNHGVELVGFGKENGEDYLILKNSWGLKFAEEGYIRVKGGNGNPCGILNNDPLYPEVA